jgi:predicted ester cyclase
MPTALEVFRSWQARLRAHDFGDMRDLVDVDGYTEICLGLTPWTVGYQVALQNYVKNMVQPWTDLEAREDQVVAGPDAVVIRSHVSATHTGEFLGIPATGRRVEWDAITMVQVQGGRVVGQWAQPDLFSIYRQLTGDQIGGVATLSAPSEGAPNWAQARVVGAGT